MRPPHPHCPLADSPAGLPVTTSGSSWSSSSSSASAPSPPWESGSNAVMMPSIPVSTTPRPPVPAIAESSALGRARVRSRAHRSRGWPGRTPPPRAPAAAHAPTSCHPSPVPADDCKSPLPRNRRTISRSVKFHDDPPVNYQSTVLSLIHHLYPMAESESRWMSCILCFP